MEAATIVEEQQVSDVIDLFAALTERAERMSHEGPREFAMAEVFGAAFAYLVEYFHVLTLDRADPETALHNAALANTELTSAQLDLLHRFSQLRG